MSYDLVIHQNHRKPDYLMNYLEDYDPEEYAKELNKHHELLIEILEDFRRDSSVKPDN